jgi:hypothetical protein
VKTIAVFDDFCTPTTHTASTILARSISTGRMSCSRSTTMTNP